MFEHHTKPLISKKAFKHRVFRHLLFAFLILAVSLAIGISGFMGLGDLTFVDAFYNTCMILGGMGAVAELNTDAAKIFSGLYALFAGIAFVTTVALLFAPVLHRFLHLMHMEE